MNPGIVKIVELLNQSGFTTVDSGDGETHDFECDREYAYVAISTEPEKLVSETIRLRALMVKCGIEIEAMNNDEKPCIQASFDPANGLALIDLQYVSDKLLR